MTEGRSASKLTALEGQLLEDLQRSLRSAFLRTEAVDTEKDVRLAFRLLLLHLEGDLCKYRDALERKGE